MRKAAMAERDQEMAGAEGGNVIVRPSLKAARQGARKKLMPVKSGPPPKAAQPGKPAPSGVAKK